MPNPEAQNSGNWTISIRNYSSFAYKIISFPGCKVLKLKETCVGCINFKKSE